MLADNVVIMLCCLQGRIKNAKDPVPNHLIIPQDFPDI